MIFNQKVNALNNPELRFKSATNEWPTPQNLFDAVNREFCFTLDVCSTLENTKCDVFFTKKDNGLIQDWRGHTCWMNPPYGAQLAKWIKKAHDESKLGALVVGLVPVRSNTVYWHKYVCGYEIRFVRGYPAFGNAKQGLKAPLALVVWTPHHTIPCYSYTTFEYT